MRDIVLNRRILVVNLPALENSDATLAALGKLVVASLRGMMAQLLGASLEGDYSEADKPGMGPSPLPGRSGRARLLRDERPRPDAGDGARPEHLLHARVSGDRRASGRGSARRPPRLLGNANLHHRHAPAGCGPHARVDREDCRADLHHPGHHLSGSRATGRIARPGMPRCGRSRASTGTI